MLDLWFGLDASGFENAGKSSDVISVLVRRSFDFNLRSQVQLSLRSASPCHLRLLE